MKTKILIFLIFLSFFIQGNIRIWAQVTIGSDEEPENYSILKIVSDPVKPGGVRLPHLSSSDKKKIEADLLAEPAKSSGLLIYNVDTNNIEYWDGAKWVVEKSDEPWRVSGTSDAAALNTQNIYQMGQVTIGSTETADKTAALNVVATDKGVLLPRVALNAYDDKETILNPTTGLLVYNTGAGLLKTVGFLYWNGTEWLQLALETTRNPDVLSLECVNAQVNPALYEENVLYNGILRVPYTGGNGASYSAGTPIASTGVTGLTATLQAGTLAVGNGELIYTVTGTPSAASPAQALFAIDFSNITCTATVGSNSLKRGEIAYWHGSMPANVGGGGETTTNTNYILSNYVTDIPVIENVFRLDAVFTSSSIGERPIPFIPRIYNISDAPVKFWWGGVTSEEGRGRSNVILASGGFQNLDNGMYMGYGNNMIMGTSTPATALPVQVNTQETMTIDLFYNQKWYRIFFTGWVDNHDSTVAANMTREIFITYERMF